MSNDRYRQALEGLRERCAQEVERITARRRAVAAMLNNEAAKPCEVAAAIRKIDVQQYYECAVGQVERDEALLRQALEALECSDWYMGQLELIVYSHDDTGTHDARAKVQSTITALRERLGKGMEQKV